MKTIAFNGSQRTYVRPAITLSEMTSEALICESLPGGGDDTGNGVAETKRRRGIFDNEDGDITKGGIW